jgi:hypothetical protein
MAGFMVHMIGDEVRPIIDCTATATTRPHFPVIRLHDARHTCGTLMHLRGVPTAVISKWLGHATASIHDGDVCALPGRCAGSGGGAVWLGHSSLSGWGVKSSEIPAVQTINRTDGPDLVRSLTRCDGVRREGIEPPTR